jgi:hypothetical protein
MTNSTLALIDRAGIQERTIRMLAREIAMDIYEPSKIMDDHELTIEQWDAIIQTPLFKQVLAEERERWVSALNTRERVEIKTLQAIEYSLPTMYAYLHDKGFADTAKVALFQALQKGAGIGQKEGAIADVGQRVQININLGEDKKLSVEHDVTPKVIEGSVAA